MLSGLPTDRFLFIGFLSAKAKARGDALGEIATVRATLIFYESGPRLADSLGAMAEVLGDRDAAVVREISKTFEETVTGRLSELSARYVDAPPKGAICVVLIPHASATTPTQVYQADARGVAIRRLRAAKDRE